MPKAKAVLLPPPMAWPITGKRGRTRSPRSPETPEHSAALFLLSLSYPNSIRESPPEPPPSEAEEDRDAEEDGETPPDRSRAARLHECSVCPKRFRTGRALGGHMKCHMERDLRGRIVKKKMRKMIEGAESKGKVETGKEIEMTTNTTDDDITAAKATEKQSSSEEESFALNAEDA